ncbi:FACT complex subunit SPT16 [Wallemia mellicola]|nr:FACT complex subunit SPT16 [Wallemia mellicola]
MSGYELDIKLFEKRFKKIASAWKVLCLNYIQKDTENEDYSGFRDADAILVPVGDLDEDSTFKKSTSLQNWLLGYEFPTTITIFLPDNTVIFIASNTKIKILKQLESANDINVELVTKTKDQEANQQALEAVVNRLAGKRIGVFSKDNAQGKSIDDWNKASQGKLGEEVDITSAIATVTAPKDTYEQKNHKYASQLSSHLLKWGMDKIMSYIDSEKKINHYTVAEQIERKAAKNEDETDAKDLSFWKKMKTFNELEYASSEPVYTPIIQSGGEYSLKPSVMSDENNLKAGVITTSLGMRYKSYCSNIGRTFFIDPHKTQEENYAFLLELQKRVIEKMTPGTLLSEVYETALNFVRKTKPELEEKLSKNLGFATGIYFRDSTYMISPKSNRKILKGMVFNLAIGFSDIKDPKKSGKNYVLSLIDTILIADEAAVCLTEGNKSSRDVMLFMENEDEEDSDIAEVKPKKQSSPKKKSHSNDLESAVIGNRMLRGKTRNAGREPDQSTAHKIKEHQKILHEAKNEEGLKRFAEGKDSSNGSKPEVFKRFDSYKREQQVPINRDLRILVDTKAQTVILPINGFIVPVHVSTIKNISKTEEGDYTSLRINFITPGQSVGKKEDVPFEDPDSMFIRSATFRSTDKLRFSDLYKDITELKKLSTKRAAEKREMADVVEQENLTEIKGRRPVRLGEVFARPIEGKRLAGDLDIHTNGVRYTTPTRDQKIDVLFSNVKHFFFQPCEHELIVLIHFHLKAPIMIGKKKTRDVQFYREATDASFDETGNRKRKIRYGDEDEIELEQEERRRRNALNKEFKGFAEKIAEASQDNFDVDIPYRELGFQGVPHRTGVLLQPTTECLVQLTDPPFTIITLAEVELAHLERVSFGLKTFDIVFVFSDFSKPVMHINSIQASQLDNVKEWLDSSDIPISEGPASLNWSAVMKTVNEDPKDFFESGGWSFLGGSGDQEDGSDESEPESQYNMSEDAVDDESEDSDEFDDSNDGSESDASDASDVSGESWDALERRAEKSDRKHYKGLDDEEGASKSSKGKRR